jgi:hypothetical protein
LTTGKPAWALVLMSLGVVVEAGVGVLVFTLARSWVGWNGYRHGVVVPASTQIPRLYGSSSSIIKPTFSRASARPSL